MPNDITMEDWALLAQVSQAYRSLSDAPCTALFRCDEARGRLVASSLRPSEEEAEQRGFRASGIMTQPNADQLMIIAE